MNFLIVVVFVLIGIKILKSYMSMLKNCWRTVEVVDRTSSNKTLPAQRKKYDQAPGPIPLPVIGNLAEIGRYKSNPFEGFTALSKMYGDIFSLTLGDTRCVVVNNLELIREVLNQNGKFFGGRPDFIRYHKLFGGDRNNSLALCDWSQLQQKRRNLARRHCSPRDYSPYFTKMSHIACIEINELMQRLEQLVIPGQAIQVKDVIQQTCANMFCQYMCSVRFDYDDNEFIQIVKFFDEIFWEINQGYALDFLPWLSVFYKKHTEKITNWSATIRKFILTRIISNREQSLDVDGPEKDFTDALLKSLNEDQNVSRDTIIYMLEDFIGGHSAVGNLVMLSLAYIAKNPQVSTNIQVEGDRITGNGKRAINLMDMNNMPYTMATLLEVLRYSSSPIVPHVATEDAVVAGYGITAGSILFINNYKLNKSEEYWQNPDSFVPERFLETVPKNKVSSLQSRKNNKQKIYDDSDSGIENEKDTMKNFNEELLNDRNKLQIKKNIPHFLPFSVGKRTCIGQNLVRGFGFVLIANILQHFNVTTNNIHSIVIHPACVALPTKTFPLVFAKREKTAHSHQTYLYD